MIAATQFSGGRSKRRVFTAIVFFFGLISLSFAARTTTVSQKKLEVNKHLKRLNKPPVKTIQEADGDAIFLIDKISSISELESQILGGGGLAI